VECLDLLGSGEASAGGGSPVTMAVNLFNPGIRGMLSNNKRPSLSSLGILSQVNGCAPQPVWNLYRQQTRVSAGNRTAFAQYVAKSFDRLSYTGSRRRAFLYIYLHQMFATAKATNLMRKIHFVSLSSLCSS